MRNTRRAQKTPEALLFARLVSPGILGSDFGSDVFSQQSGPVDLLKRVSHYTFTTAYVVAVAGRVAAVEPSLAHELWWWRRR